MNIKDFARICKCSTTTISCAFSKPEKVKESRRKKILALAEQYHFRPNRAGGSAFNGKTKTIGVLLLDMTLSFYANIAHGIQLGLMKKGYLPITINVSVQTVLSGLRRLIDQRVEGMILLDFNRDLEPAERKELEFGNVPCLYVDSDRETATDSVMCDDIKGGILAADYFLKHGHRRIAVVIPSVYEERNYFPTRFRSFITHMQENGIAIPVLSDGDRLKPILLKPDGPTALFFYHDGCAYEFLRQANKWGIRVPEDISVIGYADLNYAKMLTPALTTINQDGLAMGKRAAEIMLERIGNPDMAAKHDMLPVKLVERDSVRKISEQ